MTSTPIHLSIDGQARGGLSQPRRAWPELMKVNFFEAVPVVHCPIYFFVGKYDYNSPWQLTEAYYQSIHAPAGSSWFGSRIQPTISFSTNPGNWSRKF